VTTERRGAGRRRGVAALVLAVGLCAGVAAADVEGVTMAGSLQLDYLFVPTDPRPRAATLDGATVEMSLKLTKELGHRTTASVKICFACHGFEAGLAVIDLRASDELNLRVGRMTPAFGAFPLRHDPANHRTSDKPLVYDMGRMLHLRDWNEGILPAPWVDNGVEVHGVHFFGDGHVEYAAYAMAGPKSGADAVDFDFTLSRSPAQYYVDDNSEPSGGARLAGTVDIDDATSLAVGASVMGGRYDPDATLSFLIAGVDVTAQLGIVALRAEYLFARVELSLGSDPATRFKYGPGADGTFADYFVKDGGYLEAEVPVGPGGRIALLGRADALRRRGNVLATSALTSRAAVYRYTAAAAVRLDGELRLKGSLELYDFRAQARELAVHVGLATPF